MPAKKSKTVKKPIKKPVAKKVTKKEDPLRKARKEVKRLTVENKELREVLAEACDLALDAANMVEDSGADLDGETDDFRDLIMNRRKFSGLPEDERHVEHHKKREEKRRIEEEREQARLERRKAATQPVPETKTEDDSQTAKSTETTETAESTTVDAETEDFADVPVDETGESDGSGAP